MPAIQSPFFGINYGWTTGEASWGDPVNTNFKVLSFLGKGAVDSFVASLPGSPSDGDSVVLTTDNQFYVRLSGAWLFIQPQEGQEVNEVATEKRWKFSGGIWIELISYNLQTWAYSQTFQLVTATRDVNDAIISATIVWPDGVAGVFTTDIASISFPGAIDAWHATYLGTPARTATQPSVTRNANGAVLSQPAIIIT